MALGLGDPILLATAFPQNGLNQPAIVGDGSGSFIPFGCGVATFQMNEGGALDTNNAHMREVAPGTSGLFGKYVQFTGLAGSAFFRGAVIAELQIEISTTGGTGALIECVLVQGDGFRFLATAAAVTEVSD